MDSIDFTSHFAVEESKTGRPRYNPTVMLKIILFSFMENGYLSLRGIEKSCKADIRYMWLLDGMAAPSFATFGNFIRDEFTDSIEIKFETRTEYAIEYLDELLKKYAEIYRLNVQTFVLGKGHRKSIQQRNHVQI